MAHSHLSSPAKCLELYEWNQTIERDDELYSNNPPKNPNERHKRDVDLPYF